jgi:hypothetical protein
MRIALRRDNEVEPFEKIDKELKRFLKNQSGPKKERGVMQDDTMILLEIYRRSRNYQLRWRFDGQGAVLEEEINGVWQKTEAGDLKARFPVSISARSRSTNLHPVQEGF